jgi:site-specific DNA recombinase
MLFPEEYVFKDEGYSGAVLIRPGLERIRDLSAEGQVQAVLIYSPDRLSRNYAYQVVLMDEFASCGTEVLFVHSVQSRYAGSSAVASIAGNDLGI